MDNLTERELQTAERAARKFMRQLRDERVADFPPDDWEHMSDAQIAHALAILPHMGCVKRSSDWKWEYKGS